MKKKEWKQIEHNFFEVDEKEKIAKIVLLYHSPEDLFDLSCATKTPLLKRDTMANILNVFGLVPPKYKVDLTLRLDDFGPYTEETLISTLVKNFDLGLKGEEASLKKRDKQACGFLIAGILSYLLMFMSRWFLGEETVWRELFFYLFDIITTVSLYEAMTILTLEKREKLSEIKNLHDKFSAVHFERASRSASSDIEG